MGFLDAFGLALGLAIDTAIVMASRALAGRRSYALPWLFGVFHLGMAALGWAIGRGASTMIEDWDHWIAAALLVFIGGRMIVKPEVAAGDDDPPDRPWELFVLSVATSVDALAAGVAIDAVDVHPAIAFALIAGVCVAASTAAIPLGGWIGRRAGRHLDRVGGLLIIGVAVRIVIAHMS